MTMKEKLLRFWWGFASGMMILITLHRHFVTQDADWFTYLGIPMAIMFLISSLAGDE